MTIYLEETPVALATTIHQQMEAAPDNPSLTEPLTVGSSFPPGYRPTYNWTSLFLLGYTPDSNADIVESTTAGQTATIAMPTGGYQTGWCVSFLNSNFPAVTTGPNNWANLRYFTEPVATAGALAFAAAVEARPGWGPGFANIQRFPRPLPGEDAATASFMSLAIVTNAQKAQCDAEVAGLVWLPSLPDAP